MNTESHLTTDPNDPRLGHGSDTKPVPQSEVYLVLSKEERAKGFVRPVRHTYRHVGDRPQYALRQLTDEEQSRYSQFNYVAYEEYPPGSTIAGRFWTQAGLSSGSCGAFTTMGMDLAETYARDPSFYGSTYCSGCRMHRPVGEFTWIIDDTVVGS